MASIFKKIKNIFSRAAARQAPDNAPKPATSDKTAWHNWSGGQHCEARWAEPKSAEELAAVLKAAPGGIRPVGAGHSFSGLVPTEGTIVSLKAFAGIRSYDPDTCEANIGAGTVLSALGQPLFERNQAFKNMGDIDRQTLGGAFATATHGTGADLQSYSACVTGLELVTA